MSTSENERIAVLETKVEMLEDRLASIEAKLDKMIVAMNMGRGAWLALAKIGGTLVLLAGGAAWLIDKVWR